MKIYGDPPAWAIEFIELIAKENSRKKPEILHWKQSNGKYSNGVYYWYPEKITITAGSDKEDVKHVILHEFAHHMNSKSKRHKTQGHTVRFWKIAFGLFDRYEDIKYAFEREQTYKKYAMVVYEKYYKP